MFQLELVDDLIGNVVELVDGMEGLVSTLGPGNVVQLDETLDPVASPIESEDVAVSVGQHVVEALEAAVLETEQQGVVERAVDNKRF